VSITENSQLMFTEVILNFIFENHSKDLSSVNGYNAKDFDVQTVGAHTYHCGLKC
jgi:hypothetical protein